jgi:hypothetical protein
MSKAQPRSKRKHCEPAVPSASAPRTFRKFWCFFGVFLNGLPPVLLCHQRQRRVRVQGLGFRQWWWQREKPSRELSTRRAGGGGVVAEPGRVIDTQYCSHARTHTHVFPYTWGMRRSYTHRDKNIFMHTNLHVCVCIYVSLFVRSHGRQGTMFWIHSNRITLSVSELN